MEFALDVISCDADRADIRRHLDACPECRARLQKLLGDIDVIGGIRPRTALLSRPGRVSQHRLVYPILRAAALIIIGIAVGFGMSNLADRQPACISAAYVALSPPADSIRGYAVSDATGIPASLYDATLGAQE
jgi:hypothetical protein